MSKALVPFHLAIPVTDIDATAHFYGNTLGCQQGRRAAQWIDWDFFGHQLVTHQVEVMPDVAGSNQVDNKSVPVPHFGAVLNWQDWQSLADKLTAMGTPFILAPYVRFAGQPGEQGTMFLTDPSGNVLEFKGFKDPDQLFATEKD